VSVADRLQGVADLIRWQTDRTAGATTVATPSSIFLARIELNDASVRLPGRLDEGE